MDRCQLHDRKSRDPRHRVSRRKSTYRRAPHLDPGQLAERNPRVAFRSGGTRMTRLERQPTARPRTLHELMSIAAAMESEAVRRYGQLAADMTKRGDHGLAATFQAMLEEERDHL